MDASIEDRFQSKRWWQWIAAGRRQFQDFRSSVGLPTASQIAPSETSAGCASLSSTYVGHEPKCGGAVLRVVLGEASGVAEPRIGSGRSFLPLRLNCA